ncbi:hypothetical protein ACSBR2_023103 [Camellia fascicularis]
MATGAADMMLWCVSLSMHDIEIERRPYHRNCSCALHKSKGASSTACFQHRNILFSQKTSWQEYSLSISTAKFSSQSSFLGDS